MGANELIERAKRFAASHQRDGEPTTAQLLRDLVDHAGGLYQRNERLATCAHDLANRVQALEGVVENMREAGDELATACEAEFVGEVCQDEPDDEPVSVSYDEYRNMIPCPITFGKIRRLREALALAEQVEKSDG